jgi:hypothetical protein
MLRYKQLLEGFKHAPLAHPVILLIDNDDGAKEIFGVARQVGVTDISSSTKAAFYRICANLYLIKTPEGSDQNPKTCIEDLFDPSVRNTPLGGKSFDPDKKHNEEGKYGKAHFAERVIRPKAADIDFSKFEMLLGRIVAVIDDYATASRAT